MTFMTLQNIGMTIDEIYRVYPELLCTMAVVYNNDEQKTGNSANHC